jgi:hypothetical protein
MCIGYWRNDVDQGKPKYSEKPLFEYHFDPPQNAAKIGLGSNLGLCGERPATNSQRLFLDWQKTYGGHSTFKLSLGVLQIELIKHSIDEF